METQTNLTTKFKGLLLQKAAPRTGLLSLFKSSPENITDKPTISYHKQGYKRLTSRAKSRLGDATRNDLSAFRSDAVTPPKYHESAPLVLADFDRVQANMTEYDIAEKTAIMMAKIATDLTAMTDKMTRAEQLQAKEILTNGKILFKTDNLADGVPDLDFDCPSTNFKTLANSGDELYFDNASSKIFQMLGDHCRTIKANSNGVHRVDKLIFGNEAYSAVLQRLPSRILCTTCFCTFSALWS